MEVANFPKQQNATAKASARLKSESKQMFSGPTAEATHILYFAVLQHQGFL